MLLKNIQSSQEITSWETLKSTARGKWDMYDWDQAVSAYVYSYQLRAFEKKSQQRVSMCLQSNSSRKTPPVTCWGGRQHGRIKRDRVPGRRRVLVFVLFKANTRLLINNHFTIYLLCWSCQLFFLPVAQDLGNFLKSFKGNLKKFVIKKKRVG